MDDVVRHGPFQVRAFGGAADQRVGEFGFGPVDAGHPEEQRAHLLEERRVLEVGAKYVRVQVRKSGGDMRRLVDHGALLETRREALQDEYRDQNSGQQEMVPRGTMCGRHRPHRNTLAGMDWQRDAGRGGRDPMIRYRCVPSSQVPRITAPHN